MQTAASNEPNFASACEWWPDLPDIWTPIGWKDHLFRFNVLWDGTILACPDLNRRTEAWMGQGAEFQVVPTLKASPRGTSATSGCSRREVTTAR